MGHPLRNFWQKNDGSGQLTELWRHKLVQQPTEFSRKSCCQPRYHLLSYWLEWTHYAWFMSEYDYIWHLTLHLVLSKVIQGHWLWLTPCISLLVNLAVFGVSWGPESEYVANSHIDVFIVPHCTIQCQSGPLIKFALYDVYENCDCCKWRILSFWYF